MRIVYKACTRLKAANLIPDYPYSGKLTPIACDPLATEDVLSAILGFVDDAFINTEVPNHLI